MDMPTRGIADALRQIVHNLRVRIGKLESLEQESTFIRFLSPGDPIILALTDLELPDLSIVLTPGTYLAELLLNAHMVAGSVLSAGIKVDGVNQAPEMFDQMRAQTWRIVVEPETTVTVTAYARTDFVDPNNVAFGLNTQLIITRIGAPVV